MGPTFWVRRMDASTSSALRPRTLSTGGGTATSTSPIPSPRSRDGAEALTVAREGRLPHKGRTRVGDAARGWVAWRSARADRLPLSARVVRLRV